MWLFGTALAQDIKSTDLPGSTLNVSQLFSGAISIFLWLIAVAAFASLLYSGFQYITAGGDAAAAAKARKNIIWALMGIIIALLSYVIIRYVVDVVGKGLPAATNSSDSAENSSGTATTLLANGLSAPATTTISDASAAQSFPYTISLASEPRADVTATIETQGALAVGVTTTSLTFTKTNWQSGVSFGVTYNGNGTGGQAAQVIVKTSDGGRLVFRFEVAPQGSGGSQ